MISLFLTALLGLFCCSSINNNALDYTKEIEYKENHVKNYGYVDEHGVQLYLTKTDFCSDYFITNFIEGLVADFDPTFSYSSSALVSYTWAYNSSNIYYGVNDVLHPLTYGGVVNYNVSYNVYNISFSKYQADYVTIGQDETLLTRYQLKLLNQNNLAFFTINYFISYPFLASNGWDMGVDCYIIDYYPVQAIESWNGFCVVENTLEGVTPFVDYFYRNLQQDTTNSYNRGFNSGYNVGYSDGNENGWNNGYQVGFNTGLIDGSQYDDTALTIFTGIIEVGLLPVNVFLQILNFEVFGINISGLVSAFLTISIVIIVIRIILGNKND